LGAVLVHNCCGAVRVVYREEGVNPHEHTVTVLFGLPHCYSKRQC